MSARKRQDLPPQNPGETPAGSLSIVATPIGNLEDMPPRASRALREAEVILCEDTRHTAKLISALGLGVPMSRLERLDAHATPDRIRRLTDRLESGARMALVTDAGTPGISDPGAALVAAARERGIEVVPVPGPSALAAFLSASGFQGTAFTFRGFFPRKPTDRVAELALVSGSAASRVYLWFESPQRIADALGAITEFGPDLRVVVAKELTKAHETFFFGPAAEVSADVAAEVEREGERGEWCFAVEFAPTDASKLETDAQSSDWVKALQCLLDAGVSASGAARQVSQHFGAARNEVYESALRLSAKKNRGGD